jgi:PAS domain S-box-containing protein
MNAFGRVDGIRLRLIGLALFSALPLVALGVLRLATGSLHDRNMLASDAERAASVAAARIDERIRAADALLLGLSNTLVADPARRVENEAILLRTLEGTASPIVNLFLLDSIGTLVATARKVGPTGDTVRAFANRGYFNVVRTSRALVVGEIRRSAVLADRPWVVVLARAITDRNGRFSGVVSMPVRLDSLSRLTDGLSQLGTPLVTIFDTSGVVLARSEDPDSTIGQQRFRPGVHVDTTGASTIKGMDGVMRLTGFTRTRTAPWMINVGISQSALDARLAENLREELALFLLAIALAVTTAYFVGQRITQPVSGLVSAARGFERGDTGTRATTGGPYEIRLLGNAFNQMAETVERRNAALADSERRYRFLFDSNPLPMWAWDADTMQIMAVNEAAVEKYGYDRERFLSLRVVDLLEPSEIARFSGARLPLLRGQTKRRNVAAPVGHRTTDGDGCGHHVVAAARTRQLALRRHRHHRTPRSRTCTRAQ